MNSQKCEGEACLLAWLLESDPDDLEQAIAREEILQEGPNGETAATPLINTVRRPVVKAKEDHKLLFCRAISDDGFDDQLLILKILERFAEHLAI
ncbi:MAG: hypothetical protein ACFFGZ_01080 [Candidatus Thorarchaeota archaeon]